MKRVVFLAMFLYGLLFAITFVLIPSHDVNALPEYSVQTGEPCATCHYSPSGGGTRTARGQGWIADDKPGTVPDLRSSLKLLGVNLDFNPADYEYIKGEIKPAEPLSIKMDLSQLLHEHLSTYPGN